MDIKTTFRSNRSFNISGPVFWLPNTIVVAAHKTAFMSLHYKFLQKSWMIDFKTNMPGIGGKRKRHVIDTPWIAIAICKPAQECNHPNTDILQAVGISERHGRSLKSDLN